MTDMDRAGTGPLPSVTAQVPPPATSQQPTTSQQPAQQAAPLQQAAAPQPVTAPQPAIAPQPVTGPQPAVTTGGIPSVEQAIALREQAPELYDLWLRIAQEKAATASYVDRAPYEVPERLAQSGRPRALGALIIVLCGYLAWLGGPGPYIGGLIAILDLGVMFGMFFGLRPERLPEASRLDRGDRASGTDRRERRLLAA